ncbi:MAG: hypothetical protein PGN11_15765 [Quadrisphaera sp.]
MKLAAGRLKDREDTLALLHVTGIRTRAEIESLLRETFDDRVDAGPPEGVDLSDTLPFADGFLRLVADRPGPEAV